MLEAVRIRPALRPGLAVWTSVGAPRSDAVQTALLLALLLIQDGLFVPN